MKKLTKRLSLHLSEDFVPNLVLAFGAVLVWRGLRGLMDKYFLPGHENLSFVLSIIIGVVLIYLPDGSLRQLGGMDPNQDNPTIQKAPPPPTKIG